MTIRQIILMAVIVSIPAFAIPGHGAVTPESLISGAADAYRAMTSYQETFDQDVDISSSRGNKKMSAEFSLALLKPNKLALDLNADQSKVNIVCDGKMLYYSVSDMMKYSGQKAPDSIEKLIPEVIFGPNLESGQGIILLGFFMADPLAFFTGKDGVATYAGEADLDGVKTHKVTITHPNLDMSLWFDAKTKLLAKAEVDISRILRKSKPGSGDLTVIIRETHLNPKNVTAAIPAERFVFKPAPGAEKVDDLFAPPPDASTMKGKKAPDFELPGLNTDKPYKLSDYAGKVVMLDFWATWCGPCRMELPKLQEIHTAFKDKNFMFIAVNSRESAKKVGDFVKAQKFSFPVALDTKGIVGSHYGISSFPTLMIIGRDGKIAQVHTGYAPGIEKQLKTEIQALLDAK